MSKIYEIYYDFLNTPQVNDWFILRNGIYILPASTVIYLLLSVFVGPKIMEKKEPLNLKKFLYLYNSLGCMVNGSLIVYLLIITNFMTSLRLNREDISPTLYSNLIGFIALFIIVRLHDYWDTLWIILIKKNNQLFFNILHHSLGPNCFFFGVMIFIKTPLLMFTGLSNCLSHLLIHLYFIIYSFGFKRLTNIFRILIIISQISALLVFIISTIYFSVVFVTPLYLEIIYLTPQFMLLGFLSKSLWDTLNQRSKQTVNIEMENNN